MPNYLLVKFSRRAWARNPNALSTIRRTMEQYPDLKVTVPTVADEALVRRVLGGEGLGRLSTVIA